MGSTIFRNWRFIILVGLPLALIPLLLIEQGDASKVNSFTHAKCKYLNHALYDRISFLAEISVRLCDPFDGCVLDGIMTIFEGFFRFKKFHLSFQQVEAIPLAVTAFLPIVLFPLFGVQDTGSPLIQ